MLEPIKHILDSKKIILASNSPRRKELLSSIGLSFRVIPSKYDEADDPSSFSNPAEYVEHLAKCKAEYVCNNIEFKADIIIAADTVVLQNNCFLGKPNSSQQAVDMLKRDKAGGYGIQGIGATLISGIQGDFYNVMGFPIHMFCKKMYAIFSKDNNVK